MGPDPIVFCRRQCSRSPLGETRGILEEQFRELDATLTRLLKDAARQRAVKPVSPSTLRRKIEEMLGGWDLHRVRPRVKARSLSRSRSLQVDAVEWNLAHGIRADGLLVTPRNDGPMPALVYLPDCSESPEQICRADGPALRLAARGFVVLALRLVSRSYTANRALNNRRHLHRLGWQLGRTFLGAEVGKARSALEVLRLVPSVDPDRVGVFGYDQGGQVALLVAALDPRAGATVVSNYFGAGAHPEWQPVDRLLFGKALLFGESELFGIISASNLCVEADPGTHWPNDAGARTEQERQSAGFTREIDFRAAVRLARRHRVRLVAASKPCSEGAIQFLVEKWGASTERLIAPVASRVGDHKAATATELRRFAEIERFYDRLLSGARARRIQRWRAERHKFSVYRNSIGQFPMRTRYFQTRWKLAFDTHTLAGYEVTIQVYEGLQSYGILLVPKTLRPGERRPAVVCQHGFRGQPFFAVGFHTDERAEAYNQFGARLAERGYVVFCPYLCVPDSEKRTQLAKKAWLLGGMPIGLEAQKFSRVVDFLESLPFVDANRVGFYGLSYGGHTAMWFTPAEPRFKVVICSGHFNDWQRKTTDLGFTRSCYLYHPDEDMYNFGLLERLDHVALATLRAPRPFAVEAGLRDGVFKIEWVRSEFRRVKETYRKLGKPDNARLFVFDGPHQICGNDTFPFLDRHLDHHPAQPT